MTKFEAPDFIQDRTGGAGGTGGGGKSEICKAMAEAFPDIKKAAFDKANPHLHSKYASLGNVIDAIKPALASRGLWFVQNIHNIPGYASVETVIVHASGETMSCGITSVPLGKNDAQGYGSALTYAKRYSLSSAFSVVADEDDDGNEACNKTKNERNMGCHTTKNEEEPEEKVRMSDEELVTYAESILARLENDSVHLNDLVDYLKFCQQYARKPLKDGMEKLLETPQEFLSMFDKWRGKRTK
jgi:hypothetical protein